MNLFSRLQQALRIGKQTGVMNTTANVATVQISLSDLERYNNILFIQHYGFASVPVPGCNLALNSRGGEINQSYINASHDPRSYPSGMGGGEVQIYDGSGQKVYLQGGGNIIIVAGSQVTINAPTGITLNTPLVHMTGNLAVDGFIDAQKDITSDGDVVAGGISLKSHVHGGVEPGNGETQIPEGGAGDGGSGGTA